MADQITAKWDGLAEIRKDLESVQLGLGRSLNAIIREIGGPVAREASANTPTGPGLRPPSDVVPHMAGTIKAATISNGIAIVSSHPGAGVLEYGGTIAPRGTPFTIESRAMAHKAGEAELPRIESEVTQRINALLAAHGLT